LVREKKNVKIFHNKTKPGRNDCTEKSPGSKPQEIYAMGTKKESIGLGSEREEERG